MTGAGGGKITAKAYSTASAAGMAAGPLDWGDKCFLCSRHINIDTPPVEARAFYPGKNGMMLCHQRCLDEMMAAGGKPADFHRARREAGQAPVESAPEPEPPKPPVKEQGAGWLAFEKLSDLTAYTAKNGEIPETVKVTVGNTLVQAGE